MRVSCLHCCNVHSKFHENLSDGSKVIKEKRVTEIKTCRLTDMMIPEARISYKMKVGRTWRQS
jgi:hypothetical protein